MRLVEVTPRHVTLTPRLIPGDRPHLFRYDDGRGADCEVQRTLGGAVTITPTRAGVRYKVPFYLKFPLVRNVAESGCGRLGPTMGVEGFEVADPEPRQIEMLPLGSWSTPRTPLREARQGRSRRWWKARHRPRYHTDKRTPGVRLYAGPVYLSPSQVEEITAALSRETITSVGPPEEIGGVLVVRGRRARPVLVERFYERHFVSGGGGGRLDIEQVEEDFERVFTERAAVVAFLQAEGLPQQFS